MTIVKDLSGITFGSLTAISKHDVDEGGNTRWNCLCVCGQMTIARGTHLRNGSTKCCGGKGRGCRRFFRADMTGKVFGRLTVIGRNGCSEFKSQRISRWDCRCECGTIVNVLGSSLRAGHTKSCGCYCRESRSARSTKHGMLGTNEYRLWWSAKGRAKKYGLPFNLDVGDIVIPRLCPLLGLVLTPGYKVICQSSPTVDKIDPAKGYVRGNIWVISQQANRSKSDLSLAQLKFFVAALEAKINEVNTAIVVIDKSSNI